MFTTTLNFSPVLLRSVEERILGDLPPIIHPELFQHSHLKGESGVGLGAAFEVLHTPRH